MSTPNCPQSLSADIILASLERVATAICCGQSLDSVVSLALQELRLRLPSDRIFLGRRLIQVDESTISTIEPIEIEPIEISSLGMPASEVNHAPLFSGNPQTSQSPNISHSLYIDISQEVFAENPAIDTTASSPLHPTLALACEAEWNTLPTIWATKTGWVVPIWVHQQVWGIILVVNPHNSISQTVRPRSGIADTPKSVPPENRTDQNTEYSGDRQLLQGMATQLAIAIQQAKFRQDLQHHTEAASQLNQLKEEFLSTISHELRTPMASIKMATEMMDRTLQQGKNQAHIQHYMQILHDETDREIQLINDLLELARLEANIEPLLLNAVDLTIWLPYLLQLISPNTHQNSCKVEFALADNLPWIRTDLTYLEEILGELIHNAQKYTPPDETITVTIAAHAPHSAIHALVAQPSSSLLPIASPPSEVPSASTPSSLCQATIDPEQSVISLTVHNSGISIPTEEYERIFEKFYRIPSTDPWKHSGTGLGLALLKCRVHAIKGAVDVTSDSTGTTFTVIVPNLRQRTSVAS